MSKLKRIALIGAASLVGLVALAFGAVYTLSEAQIRRLYPAPAQPLQVERTAAAVARGERLAAIYGCKGCHGADLTGGYVWEEPGAATIHASNLSRRLADYTDGQIARAVRDGVDNEGRALWAMPSEGYVAIRDPDMADLIAWLHVQPPKGGDKPRPKFGWIGRWAILTGEVQPMPAYVAEARAKPAVDMGAAFANGRYLAQVACTECHRSELKGDEGSTPDLMIAASYDLPTFNRLMRTGFAADGKERGLMTSVARSRFSRFSEEEIAEIHAYLTARAEAAP